MAHPRTSPVALRTKMGRSAPAPPVTPASTFATAPLLSSDRQPVALDFALAVELDHRALQIACLVRAAGIDRQRLAKPGRASCLVDVTVKAEDRPGVLDRLPHGGRADMGHDMAAPQNLRSPGNLGAPSRAR